MPPAPAIGDLATREINQTLDGTVSVRPFAPDTASFTVDADKGTAIALFLTDIDTSGNRSQPSATLSFVATDTVPPPVPGGLGVTNVEQID
jgi:hypothetical protein